MTTHTTPPDAPADTQAMGIVHSALRRDVVRARMLLGTPAAQEPRRRTALAEHVLWMMGFLHHHHDGEDEGLYPLVVRCNPASAELVERMDADHATITPAMEALEQAARTHLDEPASPDELLAQALDDLSDVLFPHLAREELEMMPVVSASITEREWREWDEEFNLKPKGMRELAMDGHWILDGLTGPGREHIETLVPPVPRFILVRLMGGPYRRRRALLWDGTPAADVPSIPVDAMEVWAR